MSKQSKDESTGAMSAQNKEGGSLDQLKDLDGKIVEAIVKVKSLKEEKAVLEAKVKELEGKLAERDDALSDLSTEKSGIRGQIQDLLSELESID